MLKKAIAVLLLLAAGAYGAWQVSPWPSALFYRFLFDRGGVAMNKALAKHVPPGVSLRVDIAYGLEPSEKLDLYLPAGVEGSTRTLPLIFWVHGGGFLSGDKAQIANYLRIVAAEGYAVVGINYALTPSARHPRPTLQANAALAFISANAAKLNVDAGRIFLAGDSAGSNIAAQLAIALVEPAFANSLGIAPAVPASAIRGLILHCGIYDTSLLRADSKFGGFLKTVSWAYLGTKEVGGPATPKEFSIVANMSARMPPMFVTAGNADPLLAHSKSLVDVATRIRVPVDTLFFADDHSPPLQHEYQFDLDTAAGKLALQRSLKFVSERAR